MAERERLQKLMSQAGIASRRDAEAYVIAGRVMINGQVAKLGDRADLSVDDVRVDGEPLQKQTHFTYIMVNKPMQVVTAVTRQYQEKRQTVRDLVNYPGRLFPVGRLDADSEGLVLMTNDGDMAERMTHPRFEHDKVYDVLVRGDVTHEQLAMWQRGVVLDDGQTLPAEVQVTERDPGSTRLRITMREGRKRQIRRIAVMLGHPVIRLLRIQIGPILLGNLRPGEWRELNRDEIDALKREAGTSVRRVRQRTRGPFRPNNRSPQSAPATGSREGSYEGSRSTAHNAPRGEYRSGSRRPRATPIDDSGDGTDYSVAPKNEAPVVDSSSPTGFRSSPTRPSRMKNKRRPSADGDFPEPRTESRPESSTEPRTESRGESRSEARPESRGQLRSGSRAKARAEGRGGSRPESRSDAGPDARPAGAGRTVRQGTRRTRPGDGPSSADETAPARGPFKRPVAPPSRAKSKPPSRHPEAGGKRGSPATSKPSRSARAANPDRGDRSDRPDKAGASERSERPDRVERATRNARAARIGLDGKPNRAARRAGGPPSAEPGAGDSVDPNSTAPAAPRKPRRRPESANRSQKPNKSPHSGSRSQGGRPKKATSQSGPKPSGSSRPAVSNTGVKPKKSDKSDSEK